MEAEGSASVVRFPISLEHRIVALTVTSGPWRKHSRRPWTVPLCWTLTSTTFRKPLARSEWPLLIPLPLISHATLAVITTLIFMSLTSKPRKQQMLIQTRELEELQNRIREAERRLQSQSTWIDNASSQTSRGQEQPAGERST